MNVEVKGIDINELKLKWEINEGNEGEAKQKIHRWRKKKKAEQERSPKKRENNNGINYHGRKRRYMFSNIIWCDEEIVEKESVIKWRQNCNKKYNVPNDMERKIWKEHLKETVTMIVKEGEITEMMVKKHDCEERNEINDSERTW